MLRSEKMINSGSNVAYESEALHQLLKLPEAKLQARIIEPLLRSMGFENVRDNSGAEEEGKDLVASKTSEFARSKLYAIQIKKIKLTARISSSTSLGNLFLQLRQAREEEVVDPVTNVERSPDEVIFFTPYAIRPSVWAKFHKQSQELERNNIQVIDGSKLLDLIKQYLPDFLDSFIGESRSRVDELTLLYNRFHFDECINLEINRHSRYGSECSLAFLGLDNFKKYNNALGNAAGDKLLTQIGQLIKNSLRNIDPVFRYESDQFAIIMPQTSIDNALAAAERIREKILSFTLDFQTVVTVSIGIACWPSDGLNVDHIIDAADSALYHAKRTGGNRSCLVSQMLPSIDEMKETMSNVEKESLNTIYALASTIEARDPYTYGHSQKVRTYAVALAESLNLPAEKLASISHAALLHDIGKIGIYDEILNKPGKLDPQEFELIKTHPELSRTIVAHVTSLTPCLQAILQHHERWDGKGYPNGIKGNAISLEGRILAIADSFDAMTSKRPYRDPLSSKKAIQELKRCAGSLFDSDLVEKFASLSLHKLLELGQRSRPII